MNKALVCILIPLTTSAQYWHLRLSAGITSYLGDIKPFPSSPSPSVSIDILHWWKPWSYLYGGISVHSWKAKDNFSQWHKLRGLSAIGYTYGINAGILVTFIRFDKLNWYRFRTWTSPTLSMGIYLFYTLTYRTLDNKTYNLRKFGTEGQFSALRNQYPPPYNPIQIALTLSAGLWHRLSESWSLHLRYLFTLPLSDYFDDIHGRFPDPGVFDRYSENPELAKALSFGNMYPQYTKQAINRQRGFTQDKDRLYSLQISLVYTFWTPSCPFE